MDGTVTATKRRAIGTVVVTALLGAGVSALIGAAASYSDLLHALRTASPGWLVLCLAGVASGYVGYALLYQAIVGVQRGPRPGLPLALRLTVAVFGISTIATAAGRLGGEYWTLRRMRERPPQAWGRVLALNTAQWAILAAMAWPGALMLLAGVGDGAPLGVMLAWLLVLPAGTAIALALTSGSRRRLAEDRGGSIRRSFAAGLRAVVLLRQVGRRPDRRRRCLAGGLLHWAGDLLMVWAALKAFGIQLGYAALVVGFATGYASTMLPLPAGGAGGVEAAGTFALTLVGVPLGPALLATLIQRIGTYWLPLVMPLLSLRSMRRLGRDLASVRRPASGRAAAPAVAAGKPS